MTVEVNITKRFPGFTLDTAFTAGSETLGLLGASGCGKSLTMRCIAGIETPDEGKIVVNGQVFFDGVSGKKPRVSLSPQERKSALLFQDYQLFPHLTVEKNIAAGIARSTEKSEVEQAVALQMKRFGLEGLAKRYPLQLSGGQRQRVALARMLAAQPQILMLDEPFSALDSHLKEELHQNLLGVFEEFEGTVLYVSHDIDEAFRFCDRIAVVSQGHIDEIAPKQEILNAPKSLAALRLSGCKNTTPAVRTGHSAVHLPEWGVSLACAEAVPENVAHVGIRATAIQRAQEPGENIFRMRCDRTSDSRFERIAMLSFTDCAPDEDHPWDNAHERTMSLFKTHLCWRISLLETPKDTLPEQGQDLLIRIPPEKILPVCR